MVDEGIIMQIFYEAMLLIFKLAAPLLLTSLVVGLIIAVMQAATQIHEQTLTFVPKLAVIAIMLLFMGPWMMTQMKDFMKTLFDTISTYA